MKNFDKIELGNIYTARNGTKYEWRGEILKSGRYKMHNLISGCTWADILSNGNNYASGAESEYDLISCKPPLVIEVGKSYKTASGEKIDIVWAIAGTNNFAGVNGEYVYNFDSSGKSMNFHSHIVDVWKEKHVLKGWANIYPNDINNGHLVNVHSSKESADAVALKSRLMCIPIEAEVEVES